MYQILVMLRDDPVRLNRDRLGALYEEMGPAAAENVVCRAMEELALRFAHADRLFREGRRDELQRAARGVVAIAEQVGMGALAQVARDVNRCLDAGDEVSLAATFARLLRVGERSLVAIWDLQDVTV